MTNLVVSNTNTHTHTHGFHGCIWHCWRLLAWVTKRYGQTKLLNRKPKTSAARETRLPERPLPDNDSVCQSPPRGSKERDSCWKPVENFFHKTNRLIYFMFCACTCEVFCIGHHSTLLEESICFWIYDQECCVITPGFNSSHHLCMLFPFHWKPVHLRTNSDTSEDIHISMHVSLTCT